VRPALPRRSFFCLGVSSTRNERSLGLKNSTLGFPELCGQLCPGCRFLSLGVSLKIKELAILNGVPGFPGAVRRALPTGRFSGSCWSHFKKDLKELEIPGAVRPALPNVEGVDFWSLGICLVCEKLPPPSLPPPSSFIRPPPSSSFVLLAQQPSSPASQPCSRAIKRPDQSQKPEGDPFRSMPVRVKIRSVLLQCVPIPLLILSVPFQSVPFHL